MNTQDSKVISFQASQAQSVRLMKPSDQLDLPTQEQKKSIAQIYTEQARVYCQENNWRKAMFACKNALETAPDTADAYKVLGDILYLQGKEAEALGFYAKALTIDPNLASVYAKLGSLYAEREDWSKAADYYQQAVILDPNLAETYRNLAQVWEELGDTERALECFCRAIDLEPDTLTATDYFSFGRELYDQGKIKEASLLFIHGVRLNPQAEQELAQLVKILEELEEWQQAVVYYHQLISLPEQNDCSTTVKHSLSLSTQEKPIRKLLSSSGFKSFSNSKIVAKNTQNNIPLLPQNTAQRLLANKAEKPLEDKSNEVKSPAICPGEASSVKPGSSLSWNNLGSVYAQKQQWSKAISCYQEALQLEPNFVKSYRNLARVYHQTGEELKATFYWYEAFSIEPEIVKPEEYFSLARKLLQYKQSDKAISCLQKALELDPNFSQAQEILDRLLENSDKWRCCTNQSCEG